VNKKYILVVLAVAVLTAVLVAKRESVSSFLETAVGVRTTTTITVTTTTLPKYYPPKNQTNNHTNETGGYAGGAGGGAYPQTGANASKVITLEIIDLCQGKMGYVQAVSEGMSFCLNQKYPYYIGLEVLDDSINTWVYNISGFNQTYNISNETTIYYLFVEDVASVTRDIQEFYLVPNDTCFYLGDYTLYTIWMSNPATGEMEITKMIAALPVNVDRNMISRIEWEEIKIYLKTYERDFFLGNLFVEIK
jgi:hypothetical protein